MAFQSRHAAIVLATEALRVWSSIVTSAVLAARSECCAGYALCYRLEVWCSSHRQAAIRMVQAVARPTRDGALPSMVDALRHAVTAPIVNRILTIGAGRCCRRCRVCSPADETRLRLAAVGDCWWVARCWCGVFASACCASRQKSAVDSFSRGEREKAVCRAIAQSGQYAYRFPQVPAMPILRMTDLDLAGKRVLIRQDLNVPVANGRVSSDQRIVASLPTLRHALDAGAAVMVMSHLGRPKEGVWSEADSLAPVALRLSELLGRDVPLVREWIDGVCINGESIAPGQLVLGTAA